MSKRKEIENRDNLDVRSKSTQVRAAQLSATEVHEQKR